MQLPVFINVICSLSQALIFRDIDLRANIHAYGMGRHKHMYQKDQDVKKRLFSNFAALGFLYMLHGIYLFAWLLKADKQGNDQEPIQSNSTSCPKHQTGKGHPQLRRP